MAGGVFPKQGMRYSALGHTYPFILGQRQCLIFSWNLKSREGLSRNLGHFWVFTKGGNITGGTGNLVLAVGSWKNYVCLHEIGGYISIKEARCEMSPSRLRTFLRRLDLVSTGRVWPFWHGPSACGAFLSLNARIVCIEFSRSKSTKATHSDDLSRRLSATTVLPPRTPATHLKLSQDQVADHLPSRHVCRAP